MATFVVIWVLSSAAYVLFVGQFSNDELALAMGCGALTALWWSLLAARATTHFRFERAAARVSAQAFAKLPMAMIKVAGALLCRLVARRDGRITMQPFVLGDGRAPLAAGRRAVAILAVSLAPDQFAVRVLKADRAVELHTLAGPSENLDPWWLI